ncbi:hypothetical protein MX601_27830, partial [Escherichia coli]|nr:hypothetical protein [Escherichia coli]
FYLIHHNGLLHIKINTIAQNTPDDSCQLIRQRTSGFQEPSTGFHPLQTNTQTVSELFHTAHYRLKWHTEFGHLNRGDMLTSEQDWCPNEKKKF